MRQPLAEQTTNSDSFLFDKDFCPTASPEYGFFPFELNGDAGIGCNATQRRSREKDGTPETSGTLTSGIQERKLLALYGIQLRISTI